MSRQITLTDAEFVAIKDVLQEGLGTARDVLADLEDEGARSEIKDQKKYIATLERVLGKLRETAPSG